MNKEFIPYEQALELKKLGFDEGCLDQYTSNGELSKLNIGFRIKNELLTKLSCSAPLYQQAFRWFRKKYNLMPLVDRSYMSLYEFRIVEKGWGYTASTYEEAELACLKKLIEIVKGGEQ